MPGAVAHQARRLVLEVRLAPHAATTRHLSSAYVWQAERGLPCVGPLIGPSASGGWWAWDPWVLYDRGELTNPNWLVAGTVGCRKSTLVKTWLWWEVGAFGRWCFILDPKGEYAALAEALGLVVLRLHPGGRTRLNPLEAAIAPGVDPADVRRRQAETVVNMLAVGLERRLTSVERTAVEGACDQGVRVLQDVSALLKEPSIAMSRRAARTKRELRDEVRDLGLELDRHITGTLRGMFDGPTNIDAEAMEGRGVVLDLSALRRDGEAQPFVMLTATNWIQARLTAARRGPKRIVVLDEAWSALTDLNMMRWLQASYKLSRGSEHRDAVCNVAVIHRLSDLMAGGDDGAERVKLARGLVADTGTITLHAQQADEAELARSMLGLTGAEERLLPRLEPGEALWRVGRHAALVKTRRPPEAEVFTDTDSQMAAFSPEPATDVTKVA